MRFRWLLVGGINVKKIFSFIVMLLLFIVPTSALGATLTDLTSNKDFIKFKRTSGDYRLVVFDNPVKSFLKPYLLTGDLKFSTTTETGNTYYSSADGVNFNNPVVSQTGTSMLTFSNFGTGEEVESTVDIYADNTFTTKVYTVPVPPPPPDETVPVVVSDLAGGEYTEEKQVILTSNEPATIYYTVDGSVPTTSSAVYTNPIRIDKTLDLKYFAVDTAGNSSEVVTVKYKITIPSDRDEDGIPDAEDQYPDDATNTPPAYDESSEAADNKKTQSILIMVLGVVLTGLVMGGKGIL